MAHSGHRGRQPLALLLTAALGLHASHAHALALGEPEVRSALGEGLDLRIPVTLAKGESIEPGCFKLSQEPAAEVPRLDAARVSLERSARGTYLRIRSESPVNEPALALGVIAACAGQAIDYRREYSLLVDPRVPARAAPEAPAAARAGTGLAASLPAAVATLIARIGDTLESIADAIFPNNRAAKKSYIDALRATNPPLAALGDRDPIPVDTPVSLPDLRTFSRGAIPRETHVAAAPRAEAPPKAPIEKVAPAKPAAAPRPARSAPPPVAATPRDTLRETPRETPREELRQSKVPQTVRKQPTEGYILKLSSPEVDLSRSRAIDDRMRAQLRDRLLVLDADDQVAAVLALRNSVRQLESRVAELQLKLAGMPSTFPPPRAAEAPQVSVAKPEPVAPKPEPVAPKPEPVAAKPEPVAAAPEPPPVKQEPVAPKPEPEVAKAESPAPIAASPAAPAPAPEVKPARPVTKAAAPATQIDWLYYGLWLLSVLLVAAAVLLAWRLARRRREAARYDEEELPPAAPVDEPIVVADEFSEEPMLAEEPPAPAQAPRRELDSDVDLPTRLPDTNSDDLRRRYIEERFPEIGKGAIVLDDPASVIKGARLFYEDGALARAVELLHYAIERKPEEVRTWLALFEIFRLERLSGEFAELARRFREHHGKGEYWRKVQYFGREIDPGNELYKQPAVNTFETIGPSQARRLAAEASFDPVAENWLGMPMDFQNEVLANELRQALMSEAAISEADLVPNPMPALRNVEMFSVA